MGSLPCFFLPSPVPAIICQPDGQLYLLYHLFLVGTLNPYDRPPFLPLSLVPVITFHTNQLVNIISRLVKCILTQIVPKIVNI